MADKLRIKTIHTHTDIASGEDVWVASVGGDFFVCSMSVDDGAVVVRRVFFERVPPTIFDALIATLIAHPEMDAITHDGGQS